MKCKICDILLVKNDLFIYIVVVYNDIYIFFLFGILF